MHHVIKYIGMYLLMGIITHWAWTFIYEAWIYRKVGEEGFGDAMHHYIGLKLKLYDKHAGIREAKLIVESLANLGAAGWALAIAMTFFMWPAALCEDIAVYGDMTDYVHEQCNKTTRESSES